VQLPGSAGGLKGLVFDRRRRFVTDLISSKRALSEKQKSRFSVPHDPFDSVILKKTGLKSKSLSNIDDDDEPQLPCNYYQCLYFFLPFWLCI
jgi:hypothetical protein